MKRRTRIRLALAVSAAVFLVGAGLFGRDAAFHMLPPDWTGEAERLAAVLQLRPGITVAEIGAGSGRLAFEVARRVGPSGRVLATELDGEKRVEIERGAERRELRNVRVVAAGERDTGLPDRCCDALFMRNVIHHIEDRPTYAAAMARTLKPDAILAIIDFRPGTMLHLGADHGVGPDELARAFEAAGFKPIEQVPDWGGGMYLLAFRYLGSAGEEREPARRTP